MGEHTVTGYVGRSANFTSAQQLTRWKQMIEKENLDRKRFEKYHNIVPFKDVSPEELENAMSYYGKRLFPPPITLRAFDRVLHEPPDYNPRYKEDLHGVMRQCGINARLEDDRRDPPILINSVYNHRRNQPLEERDKRFGRALIMEGELGTSGVSLGEAPR